jgi:hypothetical protein
MQLSRHDYLPERVKVVVRVEVFEEGDPYPIIEQTVFATNGYVTISHGTNYEHPEKSRTLMIMASNI